VELFAVAAPGLEGLVAGEVAGLGATDVRQVLGGVDFRGTRETLMRANLELRVASRVLLRLGRVTARDFARLVDLCARLPWRSILPPGARLDVSASCKHCRLYHTGAVAERVERAARGVLGEPRADAGEASILVRGQDDEFTISLDTSGELLHRRGWRTDVGDASLRETLAAALLSLASWKPGESLVDPMCGAGTIVLEAASIAAGQLPGARRRFAFEAFADHDAGLLAQLRARTRPAVPTRILGGDRDERTLAAARRNLERAGLAVDLLHVDAAQLPVELPPGLILTNPPYGKRIAARDPLHALAALRRRLPGWRLAVLLPEDPQVLKILGRPRERIRLDNGGLRVFLHLF
jgi:putative N6-adenine-specific DNA methylase